MLIKSNFNTIVNPSDGYEIRKKYLSENKWCVVVDYKDGKLIELHFGSEVGCKAYIDELAKRYGALEVIV